MAMGVKTWMTAERYTQIRHKLRLTQSECARVMGVEENTQRRREKGKLPISRSAALLAELVLEHGAVPDRIANRIKVVRV